MWSKEIKCKDKCTPGYHLMSDDRLIFTVTKQLDLDYNDADMLLHDCYNLRGNEWYGVVETLEDKDLVKEFKKRFK